LRNIVGCAWSNIKVLKRATLEGVARLY